MKKRIFAIVLAALMVVPFGMLSVSADTVNVPAEPTVTNTANKLYVGSTAKGDGTAPDKFLKTTGWSSDGALHTAFKDGGIAVIAEKAYVAGNGTFSATTSPVVFTGVDTDGTSYIGTVEDTVDGTLKKGTQTGMFMIAAARELKIEGAVIFENTVIIDRTNTGSSKPTSTFTVLNGGSIVIKDSVTITKTNYEGEKSDANPILNIEEGGYAYLHAVGFSAYTGKGTIVLDKKLVDNGTATQAMFEGFEGNIVDKNGNAIVFKTVADTSDDTTTTTTPAGDTTTQAPTTDNPSTGDMTLVVAALAAFSVAACISVVIVKKTKEN